MDYHNKMKLLLIVVLWQVVVGQNYGERNFVEWLLTLCTLKVSHGEI
jgi:hypothetical protein